MVTVHASGGSAVLRAAVEAARPFPQLKVLALTVITSMRDQDLQEIGLSTTVAEQVVRLARLSVEAGCHGVMVSLHHRKKLSSFERCCHSQCSSSHLVPSCPPIPRTTKHALLAPPKLFEPAPRTWSLVAQSRRPQSRLLRLLPYVVRLQRQAPKHNDAQPFHR